MPVNLTQEEETRLEEFLAPARIAVVATVGKTGMPQLTPNWYRYSGGRLTISITKERVKYRNLSSDNRMAVCVYSDTLAHEYVTLRGSVEISDDESIWPETRAIVERYTAPEGGEARLRTLRTQNRVIVTLDPDRVLFRT